ncbi:MAG: glucosaminidase domain-containing protein [Prevotella sp.]|nr:glucosaminidase domain-containing protein [Prevotella sp.]
MSRLDRIVIVVFVFSLCANLSLLAQGPNSAYQDYINRYKDLAIEQMLKWKVPASITLAQGLLESGAGKSELAQKGNNHFGIKCHGWTGAKTYHDDDLSQECFRAYNNVRDSYEDHSQFLARQTRYSRLFTLSPTDYRAWAHGLKACGYATSPTYAQKLIGIIELYNLSQYDHAKSYSHFAAEHLAAVDQTDKSVSNHSVYFNNKNYYVRARKGDTFASIAREFNLNYRRIARYNERSSKSQLEIGELVYLEKKQKRAEKKYKKQPHTVRAGESLYSIAQLYGVRLKNLCKKNNINLQNYTIKVGDRLRVY